MNPQVYESVYLCAALLIERLSLRVFINFVLAFGQRHANNWKAFSLCWPNSRKMLTKNIINKGGKGSDCNTCHANEKAITEMDLYGKTEMTGYEERTQDAFTCN